MIPRTPSKAYTWPGLRYSYPWPSFDHDSVPAGGTTTVASALAGGAGTATTAPTSKHPATIAEGIRPIISPPSLSSARVWQPFRHDRLRAHPLRGPGAWRRPHHLGPAGQGQRPGPQDAL